MSRDPGDCLAGERLHGDDFTPEEIAQWFEDEREGYAKLRPRDRARYVYAYHALNRQHGYRHLPAGRFRDVLCVGGAYGDELLPIAPRTDCITILEPSQAFPVPEIAGVPVASVEPDPSGELPFDDDRFDLLTCFGVLHHIPNVSTVMREFARCLAPGGWALVREPIVSLGDWRRPRAGLTKRERGIPIRIFHEIIAACPLTIVQEQLCIFPLTRRLGPLLGRPAFDSDAALVLDRVFSALFAWNAAYHATSAWGKLRPTNVFFVLRKKA